MVLIKYTGDVYPVTVYNATGEEVWNKDEVKDVGEVAAKILLRHERFHLVTQQRTEAPKATTKESVEDLNRDGVVDRADAVIAGKVLAEYKKNK